MLLCSQVYQKYQRSHTNSAASKQHFWQRTHQLRVNLLCCVVVICLTFDPFNLEIVPQILFAVQPAAGPSGTQLVIRCQISCLPITRSRRICAPSALLGRGTLDTKIYFLSARTADRNLKSAFRKYTPDRQNLNFKPNLPCCLFQTTNFALDVFFNFLYKKLQTR